MIMVTADGREEMMQLSEAQGLDGFLIKPVNPSMLFDMIMQVFGKEQSNEPGILYRQDQNSEALQALHGANILLVEDNEINQQVAEEILSAAGFKVSIANNGLEAVNAVKENDYDAVLMDVQMPVMDGYTAAREIRKWESVSANADSDIWETEARGQRTEVGRQRTEVGRQRTEGRSQNAEDKTQASNLQPPTFL